MNHNSIVVFDFESTQLDKNLAEIWQIGAMAIRVRDLRPYDTHFNIMMRVLEPDKANPESLAVSRMTIERIMDEGMEPGEGWHQFAEWVAQFNLGGKTDLFNCPISGGFNIINYDLPIYERYCYKYKTLKKDRKLGQEVPGIFNPIKRFDVLQLMGYWTENLRQPTSLSLVNLRKFMGASQENIAQSHDALADVKTTTDILIRLLKLSRSIAPKVKFKNCFAEDE